MLSRTEQSLPLQPTPEPAPLREDQLALAADGGPALPVPTIYRNLDALGALGLVGHTHLDHRSPAYHLAEHSGQVAFPGGRSEPGDRSPEATALREAHEEIGLPPGEVHILGRLNDFITITNYAVTPVVGHIPWPFDLAIQTEEVSRVFTIPLEWLSDPLHHEVRKRSLKPLSGHVDVIYFQPYDGELLWGATARFTLTLLKILGVFGD